MRSLAQSGATHASHPTPTMFATSPQFSMTSPSSTPRDVINTSRSVIEMTSFVAMTTDGRVDGFNSSRLQSLGGEEEARFLEEKNEEFTALVLPAMVVLGIFFVAGVVGNSMVLYVYNRKLQKGTIRWFVQALAIFDLLSCLVAIPGEIIDMRNNYTFGSSPMCKVLRTVSMFCTVSSGMTLMVVAVERYKRICTPLKKQITPKGAQVIITLCTVVASICAAPASIFYGPQTIPTNRPHINGTDCSTADVFLGTPALLAFSVFQFLLFTLSTLGLVALYLLIGRKVWSLAHFRRSGMLGVNRRMSLFFSGSECSSPTTDVMVFTFPAKKTAAVTSAEEDNSNTSQGNNDNDNKDNDNNKDKINDNDNNNDNNNDNGNNKEKDNNDNDKDKDKNSDKDRDNNNVCSQPEPVPAAEGRPAERLQEPGHPPQHTAHTDPQHALKPHHAQQPFKAEPQDLTPREERRGCPDSPCRAADTFPPGLDTFRRARPTSRAASRDRVQSGDSAAARGRYQRRAVQHTQSDRRRFLHRSESLNSGTRRTTWMLFLITLVYLLSFLPYLVLNVVKVLDRDSLSGRGGGWELAHNILLRSYFINSMANPIIYSFCSRTFRQESSKVLHCRCCTQAFRAP